MEFSVAYNNDPSTLDELFKQKSTGNNSIREIYLSGPTEYSGSGRIVSPVSFDALIGLVTRIHREGIRVNLVLNTTCEGSEWYSQDTVNSTMEYLGKLHEVHGVESVTIANPLYINEARRRFSGLEICASVLANIDCVQRALLYRQAGADVITPDVNINRDLEVLLDIKQVTGARLKLLVNEGCLYKCPFRQFHFNAISHVSKEACEQDMDVSFADFFGVGVQVIRNDRSQLFKSCWIRPEDLNKYLGITDYFKLACRNQPKSTLTRITQAYMQQEWHGDLLDLVSGCSKKYSVQNGAYIDNEKLNQCGFFEKVSSCRHECHRCSYCDDLAQKLVKVGVYTKAKIDDVVSID